MNIVRHLVRQKVETNTGSVGLGLNSQVSNDFTRKPKARVINDRNAESSSMRDAINRFIHCYRSKRKARMVNNKPELREEVGDDAETNPNQKDHVEDTFQN